MFGSHTAYAHAVIFGLLPFAISMGATPGPNNILITNSAATFGIRRTVPPMIGIAIGFPLMVLALGAGLAPILQAVPEFHRLMQWLGAAYLVYLAYNIAFGPHASSANVARAKPMTLIQAALFQWVNPKAWIIAVSALTTYTGFHEGIVLQASLMAGIFAVTSLVCVGSWALIGSAFGAMLVSAHRLLIFNRLMALLLLESVVQLFVS